MRLRQWLSPTLASLAKAASAYRVNTPSVVFCASCWLVFSAVRELRSTAHAKLVLGAILLFVTLAMALFARPKETRK